MKFKKILPQFLTLLFIVLIFGFFTMNAQENMDTRGIEFGFGFLSQEASFDIQFSLIEYDGSKSYARAYLVGLLNTLLSIFYRYYSYATILGVIIIGVARLSPNYLINKTASFYVEFFRNVPLLLQIFFWYFAALRASTDARRCSFNFWVILYDHKRSYIQLHLYGIILIYSL